MDRKVSVERVSYKGTMYENSPKFHNIFCNLVLQRDMKKEDMKKNRAKGSIDILGFTKGEAETAHRLLGEVLK